MDKKILIGAGVVIILIAVAGFLVTKNAEAPVSGTTIGSEESNSTMMRRSLKDLLSLQDPMKCVSTFEDENVSTMSTTYTAGGRVRADVDSTDKNTGQRTTMNNIVDSNFMYLWGIEPNKGFKITLDAATKNTANGEAGSVDLDTAYDFDCKSWEVDESLLTPPATVQFTDMSDILKATSGNTGVGAGGNMCAVCDQASDATAKAECRAQLNCQ